MTRPARPPPGRRVDLGAAAAAMALIGVAAVTDGLLYLAGRPVQASAAPFYAHRLPHVGPGTIPVVLTASGQVSDRRLARPGRCPT